MDYNENEDIPTPYANAAKSNSSIGPLSTVSHSRTLYGLDDLNGPPPCSWLNPFCLAIDVQTTNRALIGVDTIFKISAFGVLVYILTVLQTIYPEVQASQNQQLDKNRVLELIILHIMLITAYSLTIILNIIFCCMESPSWILFMLIYRILQGKLTIIICILIILRTEHNLIPIPIRSHRSTRIAQHVSLILAITLISIVLLEYYIAWNHVGYLFYVRSDDFKHSKRINRIEEHKRKVLRKEEAKRNNRVHPEESISFSDFQYQEIENSNQDELAAAVATANKPQRNSAPISNRNNNRVYSEELLMKPENMKIPIPPPPPPCPCPLVPPLPPPDELPLNYNDNLNRLDDRTKRGRRHD